MTPKTHVREFPSRHDLDGTGEGSADGRQCLAIAGVYVCMCVHVPASRPPSPHCSLCRGASTLVTQPPQRW